MNREKTIDMLTTVVRNQEIIFSEMDDEIVMMSIEKGEYYGVNPVGRRIWEIMETPVMVSVLCDTLGNEYDVDPDQCRRDVLAFLAQLSENDILKVAAG